MMGVADGGCGHGAVSAPASPVPRGCLRHRDATCVAGECAAARSAPGVGIWTAERGVKMAGHAWLDKLSYNTLVVDGGACAKIDPVQARYLSEGGYAWTYAVTAQPGLPVSGIMKVYKHNGLICKKGERFRFKTGWKQLDDEYNMLRLLEGLDGHVPQAYASGFYVEDMGDGTVLVRPAFIMEEIADPAKPLSAVLREHGSYRAEQVALFGLKLLDILDLLQNASPEHVAHADLSPNNVLVRRTPDGQSFDWLYLIDFGQSKYSEEGVTPSMEMGGHERFGTLPYTAPELLPCLQTGEGDPAYLIEHNELYRLRNRAGVDVWSLGALMYLLARGEAPRMSVSFGARGGHIGYWHEERLIGADEAYRILLAEKHDGIGLPASQDGACERLLDEAIRRCTAWDPRNRDRDAIRRLLEQAAPGSGGTSASDRTQATQVPQVTPVMEGMPLAAPGASPAASDAADSTVPLDRSGTREASASSRVFAATYKIMLPDGTPYSQRSLDLLVFGDSEACVSINSYRVGGKDCALVRVGEMYDMTSAGWTVSGGVCDSPWQDAEIVDVLSVIRPRTLRAWFAGCAHLTEIRHIERLDTSRVTNMRALFQGCRSLASLDVSSFKTAEVEDFSSLFQNCSSLLSLDVSTFDTGRAELLSRMFAGCRALRRLDVSGFATGKVYDMSGMFDGCQSLEELDVSAFDTSSVLFFSFMFAGCGSLTHLDVSRFNTSSAQFLSYMFRGCASLTHLDVSGFDTSDVVDFSGMFEGCSALDVLEVSSFDTSGAMYMHSMFEGCASLRSVDVLGFFTSCALRLDRMFAGCSSLQDLDVGHFDTSSAENLSAMFEGCSALDVLEVSGFDTSHVLSMDHLFAGCSSLYFLDVSGFETAQIESFSSLFEGCSELGYVDVSGFDTSSAEDLSRMFADCRSMKYVNVSSFDFSRVRNLSRMFAGCWSLETIAGGFESVRDDADTTGMFDGCMMLEWE